MKHQIITLLLLLLLTLRSYSSIDEPSESTRWFDLWEQAGATWYDRWMTLADQAPSMETSERIGRLSRVLGTKTPGRKLDDEAQEVFDRIQLILLDTPGHAEYFEKRIKDARLEFEKYDKEGDQYINSRGVTLAELLETQMRGFQALGHMPSPETVRVLGEFLTDERGRIPIGMRKNYIANRDRWLQEPNSVHAARGLQALPLKVKPHAPSAYFGDAEPPREWINWYQQIKEGRRTFSFEGDPNEYDLNGPVRAAKNPDNPRVNRRQDGTESAQATKPARESAASSPTWIAAIIAASLALGGWLFLRRKQAT